MCFLPWKVFSLRWSFLKSQFPDPCAHVIEIRIILQLSKISFCNGPGITMVAMKSGMRTASDKSTDFNWGWTPKSRDSTVTKLLLDTPSTSNEISPVRSGRTAISLYSI